MKYLKMMGRIILWLPVAIIDTLFGILSVIFVNWWVILFGRPCKPGTWQYDKQQTGWKSGDGEQVLPKFLNWFETFDASLDAGWLANYFTTEGQYSPENPPSFWKRKYYQWKWLNRNPAYSFSYYVTGTNMKLEEWNHVTFKRVPTTSDKKGYWLFIAISDRGFFNINLQGRYGSWKLGWKVWNYWSRHAGTWYADFSPENAPWGPEWRTQIVLSINPFKRNNITENN